MRMSANWSEHPRHVLMYVHIHSTLTRLAFSRIPRGIPRFLSKQQMNKNVDHEC